MRLVALEGEVFVLKLEQDRKSTRLNSSHLVISYAVFCLKKKKCVDARVHGCGQHALVRGGVGLRTLPHPERPARRARGVRVARERHLHTHTPGDKPRTSG